mgnify:CR=1 FL=1
MLSWEYEPNIEGGLGRHVTSLSRALAERGASVTVVTPLAGGAPQEDRGLLSVRRVADESPPALTFPERVAKVNAALLQAVLREVSSGGSFDLVHAHDWLTAYAARAVKHGLGIPLVATIHATEHGRNQGLYTDLQRHISDIEWWLTYEAWRVICCSRAMRQELESIFQLPADKMRVIPNGVDLPAPRGGAGESPPLENPGRPLVFFVGRLVYEKGVDILISSFRRVLEKFPEARLLIAGRGPEEPRLKDMAERLGGGPSVQFLGYISDDERNRLYRLADAVAFPSRYEPFGIVALEAMSQGAPVVAARTGGFSEVIDHGRTGLLFDPGDAAELAEAIAALLGSAALRRRLGAAARSDVASRYDWGRIGEATIEVYREVLGARGTKCDDTVEPARFAESPGVRGKRAAHGNAWELNAREGSRDGGRAGDAP